MGLKEASFIYLDGLKYYEKKIAYQEFPDDVEIQSITNIQFSAENISGALLRSMKKEIGNRFSQTFRNQPFYMERSTYGKPNETRRVVIVGENHLVVKKGSFCDERILRPYQRYYQWHQNKISDCDISKHDLYESLLKIYQAMMDGMTDQTLLWKACSIVPTDVYLEMLQLFRGMAGFDPTWIGFQKAKEKTKVLLDYYQK